MATYVNNLRLKEITTGDEDGTWGTSTNTNLELIGEALGYNTQDGFATDADATTTVAAAPSSAAKPRDGVNSVIFLPIVAITFQP